MNDPIAGNPQSPPQGGGFKPNVGISTRPQDYIRALLRWKWVILILTVISLCVAAVMYKMEKPLYSSSTKLWVRYVIESYENPSVQGGGIRKTPDSRGYDLINTELEILTSWDIAQMVVTNMNAGEILKAYENPPESSPEIVAAARILKGLNVSVPRGGNIIQVTMTHPDPLMAQRILKEWVNQYRKRHFTLHRGSEDSEFLRIQRDELKTQLISLDESLNNLKSGLQLVSINEEKSTIINQIQSLRSSLFQAQAELASRGAKLEILTNELGRVQSLTNFVASENYLEQSQANSKADEPSKSWESNEKAELVNRLSQAKGRLRDLERQFTDQNLFVKKTLREIEELKERLSEISSDSVSPGIASETTISDGEDRRSGSVQSLQNNANLEKADIHALNEKIKYTQEKITQLTGRLRELDKVQNQVSSMEREKEILESKYRYFHQAFMQSKIDQDIDVSKIANIGIVQEPTLAVPHFGRRQKNLMVIAFSGLFLGIGLAVVREVVLNNSLKSANDLKYRFAAPALLTIPDLNPYNAEPRNLKNYRRLLLKPFGKLGSATKEAPEEEAGPSHRSNIYKHGAELHKCIDALRDRLLLNHIAKQGSPDVIGMTSLERGAGVSTVSRNLAQSLSFEGGRGVLYARIGGDKPSYSFFMEGLETDHSVDSEEFSAMSLNRFKQSLFSKNGRDLATTMVRSLKRLKENDQEKANVDYIILDLPPILESSVVPRVLSHAQSCVVVLEEGKSNYPDIQRGMELLAKTRVKTAFVINKHRSALPKWLPMEM